MLNDWGVFYMSLGFRRLCSFFKWVLVGGEKFLEPHNFNSRGP